MLLLGAAPTVTDDFIGSKHLLDRDSKNILVYDSSQHEYRLFFLFLVI
jgi:hypothetical protein